MRAVSSLMVTDVSPGPDPADELIVRHPGTGAEVGRYKVCSDADVRAAVERARTASRWWAELTFVERATRLDRFRGTVARGIPELAALIRDETGKPYSDAALEVSVVLDHVKWAAKNASKVLGKRRVSTTAATFNHAASVEYRPLGVIGVIGPWNYPAFTPLGSIVYALAAGNAVVFKPSEYTPGVGAWLVDAFADAVPEHPVLQLVTGGGATGAALCRAGVDKIAFTGSTATARKVMAACAETLTPMVAECGGKDAMIVDVDADLDAAADGALWAGMANAGQSCIGVERVYVHEQVYDEFVQRVVHRAQALRAGADDEAKIGPITMPGQLDVIRRHIDDALERGGQALVGGRDAIDGGCVQPTVLVDVPEDSLAVTEETFGPTFTIAKVADMDEAVERANAGRYGLAMTVFSRRNGSEIAARVRSGMASVNAVFNVPQIPSLPFGGVDDSGFGRVHGADGLREFTYAHAVARQRFKPFFAVASFARTKRTDAFLAKLAKKLHGSTR